VARNLTPNLIKRLGHNAGEFLRVDGRCALNPRLQDTLRPIPSLKFASGVENPGEVLVRVREQLEGGDQEIVLEVRLLSLQKRLATKQAERDRAMRLYMRGLISEEEADVLLADLKNQADNLRLLIESVEADIAKSEESKLTAMNTEAWLMALRENLTEVEQDTEEAYLKRRELVKLLVEKISADRGEDGRVKVDITYRFDPVEAPPEADILVGVQGIRSYPLAKDSSSPLQDP
jgi:hypothetical protein